MALPKKYQGMLYPAGLIVSFTFIYISMMLVLMFSNRDIFFNGGWLQTYSTFFVLAFHILFLICAYCYITCMFKSPGSPPRFWGFYLQDPQEKQKKMCMTCNSFKPERTHHCSTCGRCVLVLDHHCPWLNNCVGFFNRKFFMLLISYAFVFCIFTTVFSLVPIITLFSYAKTRYGSLITAIIGLALSAVGIYIMWGFITYHYDLVKYNKTTIDEMDRKRGNNPPDYNFGPDLNYKFVFGNSKICWPVPYDKGMAAPLGDGVVIKMSDYSEAGRDSRVIMEGEGGAYGDEDRGKRTGGGDWDLNNPVDPLNTYNINKENYGASKQLL